MNWLHIKRSIRSGLLDFWRNGFVSFASVLMMTFTLLTIGLVMFAWVVLSSALAEFRNKADMNIYFTTGAREADILALKSSLETLPEVASVTYVSREEVLADFRERHQNDQRSLQALEELGENPFPAEMNVKAKEISQYDAIANFLGSGQTLASGTPQIIEKINYYDEQHRRAIDTIAQYTNTGGVIAIVILGFFVLMTIAIAFNTLRLAIYSSREEIQVMRLVGAAQMYVRAPFVVEGVLYGLIAALLTLLLLYPLAWWLGDSTEIFFGNINVFDYYLTHFFIFFVVIVGTGVALGAVASFLAVRRYLKI